ncbi:winged helix-turn-helix transcriptional regulator [Roseibium sp. SCP14]|uniref:winged helix-turn-helix transcriptional regulator n=1 Tax=Roseibium sp. SCP14 TaxID=3141375 RepID=UPI003339E830
MALFDLLRRPRSLGNLWQLTDNPLTSRELQSSCESVSSTVLNRRLKELRAGLLIDHDSHGYELTEMGRELFGLLEPFGQWSIHWVDHLSKYRSEQG